MSRSIPEVDLIAALKSLAGDLGRPPTRDEMEAQGAYSATPYYRQFGSWPSALKRAGLEPQYRQEIPDEELLAALQNLADELTHPPRQQEMATRGPFSPSTYRRRFGSWATSLEKAGLEPDARPSPNRIEQAELIRALHQLTRELGRPPTQSDVETHGPYSIDVYHDRFGSWSNALKKANLQLE
ncbi:homing endonuclease associated repeat-containing protein [Halorussus salinisoli]|uniref:homing endonuclease associated repeat-containing protein n=1 Tax=Halorussus salinisoli TaxID=2558242 RepID=UPI0014854956